MYANVVPVLTTYEEVFTQLQSFDGPASNRKSPSVSKIIKILLTTFC